MSLQIKTWKNNKPLPIWKIYYAIQYGVMLNTLEELDEYLEKKNRL